MAENEVVGRIKIEIAGDAQAASKIKAVQTEQKRLADTVSQTGKLWFDQGDASQKAARIAYDGTQKAVIQERHLATEVKKTNETLLARAKFAVSAIAAQIDATRKLRAAQTETAQTVVASVSSGRSGGGQGIAGVVQRAAGAVGLGGVSEISGVIDDVGDLTKAIGESGISAGKAALSLGVAGVALVAIGVAVKVFSDNLDKGARAVQQAVDSLGVYYNAIQNGTSGSIQKQLEAAQAQKKLLDDQIATIENARAKAVSSNDLIGKAAFAAADVLGKLPKTDELTKQAATAQAEIDGLTRALNSSEVAANNAAAAYEAESKAIIASITEQANQTLRQRREIAGLEGQSSDSLSKRAAGLKDEIKATTEYLNTLQSTGEPSAELDRMINQAMLDLQIMTGTLSQIEKVALPAAAANERYKKSLEDVTKAADEYANNSRTLITLAQQRAKVEEDRARTDARNAQVSALEAQIGAAKELEAAQEKTDKIISLRKKAGTEELEAAAKYGNEAAKVNREFMQNELTELASYRKAEERATDQYATERRRKLEDLTASLSELASKGDVAGFIRAQRAGGVDLNRGAEDFTTAERQRLEDFQAGVTQRQQEREAKLADLQASFIEERNARQANLAEQIAQETEAGKQRVLRSVELEKQLSALKEQFAIEDAARQRQQEDAAYQEQVKALTERNRQLAVQIAKSTDPVINAAGRLVKTVGDELNRAIANLRAGASRISHSSQAGAAVMNATGGIYTQPTFAMLGEKKGYGDVVLPFKQSEGFESAARRMGGTGGGVTVNINNPQFGAVATPADLARVESRLKGSVVAGIEMAKQRGA